MTTLGALEKRIERLEARHPSWAGYPNLEPPTSAFLRVVLGILVESGVFVPPPDATGPWRDACLMLRGLDDPSAERDADG